MKINNILNSIELPAIYNREGKDCYFDTYRKKLIEITPEETVRQKVAALFEHKYGVPKDMISLEVPMSYYVEGAIGRADIIIHAIDEEKQCLFPITVIECKNEDVFLTDKVTEQAIGYCEVIGGKYIVLTNGIELKLAVYNEESDNYVFLEEILSYKQMINKDYLLPEIEESKTIRFSLDQLKDQDLISAYNDDGPWIFGESTKEEVRSFSINFYQALLDTNHQLPIIKKNNFELIEDIGQRCMDYSNAGGGHYNGIYRAFLIKDRFGETQIVSMSLFGTDANFRGENRNSYTSLTVAIDRFKTSHNSLQYNIDKFVDLSPDGVANFTHNGQIGGIKSKEVIETVSMQGDGIKISQQGIFLGTININKILFLDDRDVSELVYNLIEYALLREEVRRKNKLKL